MLELTLGKISKWHDLKQVLLAKDA